jgi:hypothetical protein
MMDKQTLQAALKKMPADAKKIRVGTMWSRKHGKFEYVSFESKLRVNKFHWDLAPNQRWVGEGAALWIGRIVIKEEPQADLDTLMEGMR